MIFSIGRGRSRLHAPGARRGTRSRSPGSRPGPKAGTKPLRHPGIPMAVFLPQPSYHAALGRCSSSFTTASCPPPFFLEVQILSTPNHSSSFSVDLSFWLIIISFNTTPALLCYDSKICRDASSNTLGLRSLTSFFHRSFLLTCLIAATSSYS